MYIYKAAVATATAILTMKHIILVYGYVKCIYKISMCKCVYARKWIENRGRQCRYHQVHYNTHIN